VVLKRVRALLLLVVMVVILLVVLAIRRCVSAVVDVERVARSRHWQRGAKSLKMSKNSYVKMT